jgi:hypothetical protein
MALMTGLARPRLTFACELDPARLTDLFSDASVIADLQALDARVALMLSDFSSERAGVVRKLNAAGIPVIGIPLMPYEDGYFFTVENASRARARYDEWKAWTARHELVWHGVGLDIEPEARVFEQLMERPWGVVPLLVRRLGGLDRVLSAREAYAALIDRIRADGYPVENYQFPLIADERRVESTLLQRLLGLADVTTDREVWMLYTSVIPVIGAGLLWSYGPEAPAIAVGTTGGGPDIPGHPEIPALDWDETARDLRLARHWSDDIYIHSLEGCVRQGFLPRLRTFDWQPVATAPPGTGMASGLRRVLRGVLWTSAHPGRVAAVAAAAAASVWAWRRWRNAR